MRKKDYPMQNSCTPLNAMAHLSSHSYFAVARQKPYLSSSSIYPLLHAPTMHLTSSPSISSTCVMRFWNSASFVHTKSFWISIFQYGNNNNIPKNLFERKKQTLFMLDKMRCFLLCLKQNKGMKWTQKGIIKKKRTYL